mmetsp:Transcript_1965/g.2900  ORF Transcript_1965/g.2900 Transcript_1965/m.2900 type:complete len:127 (-) Transcript_1965:1262-1642(-)
MITVRQSNRTKKKLVTVIVAVTPSNNQVSWLHPADPLHYLTHPPPPTQQLKIRLAHYYPHYYCHYYKQPDCVAFAAYAEQHDDSATLLQDYLQHSDDCWGDDDNYEDEDEEDDENSPASTSAVVEH